MKPDGMTRQMLCAKITEIFPDVGECGIDVDVRWDDEREAWIVDLQHEDESLQTYLEPSEAAECLRGDRCVRLGFEIGQLRANVEKLTEV